MDSTTGIKVIINGEVKETIPNTSVVDLGWFVKSLASKEGIKNFTVKVNGEQISHKDMGSQRVSEIQTLELSTFDVAR